MNRRSMEIVLIALLLCGVANTQTASDDWVGIWHANVGSLPTGTLTLATDTGSLGGTLVLDIISREEGEPQVIASEPHVLLNLSVSDRTLAFQVKMRLRDGGSVVASFEVKRTATDKATIHCTDCGRDAPVVELERSL